MSALHGVVRIRQEMHGDPSGSRRGGTYMSSRRVARSDRWRTKACVALLAAALLPLVAASVAPQPVAAQTPEPQPHIFDANAAGQITNRRPANVSHLGVSDGALRIEDSREATAGSDGGFVVQPQPNTMQQVINTARWGSAHSAEVVDTAVGFLSNYTSTDLVVLRGSSGRWADRNPAVPTTLTWWGPQRTGFRDSRAIDLGPGGANLPAGEVPVGVEIVNNGDGFRYLVLATDKALYAFTPTSTGPGDLDVAFTLRHTRLYAANEKVLGIHHVPQWAASAAEQWREPCLENCTASNDPTAMVGVLLSDTAQRLTVQFVSVFAPSLQSLSFGPRPEFVVTSDPTGFGGPDARFIGAATGGDLRYSFAQTAAPSLTPMLPFLSRELRVDVNLTTAAPGGGRFTEQWAGRSTNTPETFSSLTLLRRVTESTCQSPATGFDAAYFRAASTAVPDRATDLPGAVIEAHVVCASPGAKGADLGGYERRSQERFGTRGIPRTTIDAAANTVAVRPQVSLSFPCLEQLRYQLRLVNPQLSGDMSPASLRAALASDAAYMRTTPNWRNTFQCSAQPNSGLTDAFNYTHRFAGNVTATVSVPQAAPGTGPLAERSAASSTALETRSLVVPKETTFDVLGNGNPVVVDVTPTTWRAGEARTDLPPLPAEPTRPAMSPGVFLTRLPSTDVVELVRLTDTEKSKAASCARFPRKADGTPGDRVAATPCDPSRALGGPIPIAVMAAPPYVKGTGQAAQITPEFANGTSATQENSRFTSTSVGAELELSRGIELGDSKVVEVEVEATAAVGYERETESSTSEALTIGKTIGYGGSLDNDTIVTNKVRYLEYSGRVEADSVGVANNSDTVIRVPIGNTTTSQTLNDLLADPETSRWWAADGPFAEGLRGILTHVPGMPGTYLGNGSDPDAQLNDYCIGNLDPAQGFKEVRQGTPAAANPFIGAKRTLDTLPQILTGEWGFAQAGNDITTQRSNIEFGRDEAESFLESNTVSATVSLRVKATAGGVSGGVKGSVTAAGSWGNSFGSSLGTNTTFSGSVGSLPDPRLGPDPSDPDDRNEQFGWRMFVCKREIAPGFPVWVQGYQVRDYNGIFQVRGQKNPENLGEVTVESPRQSRSVDTTPALTWTQPEGTVQDYGIEIEAVGRFDVRSFTVPPTDGTGAPLAGWPATSARAATQSFTVPDAQALLPNQLYRWRTVSNNFFYGSESSPWEFFVTEGAPRSTITIDEFSGYGVVDQPVKLRRAGDDQSVTTKWLIDGEEVASTATGNTDTFNWTPTSPGIRTVTMVVSNTQGSSTDTRTIVVAPGVANDTYRTDEDQVLDVGAPGVIGNDPGATSASLLSTTPDGLLSFVADGSFDWTPRRDACGPDGSTAFQYTPAGGGISSPTAGVVAIEVDCVDDAPEAVADEFIGVPGQPVAAGAPGVLANDIDVDLQPGEELTATLVAGPAKGQLDLSADGSFTWTPPTPEYCGVETFTYRVVNGSVEGGTAQVRLESPCVEPPDNQPPVAAFEATASSGTPLGIDVDGTASTDPDGTIAAYEWDFGDGSTGSGATASHVYAAPGTYMVSLTVTDDRGGTDVTSQQVEVVLAPPPVPVAAADSHRTAFGTTLEVRAPGVLGNDSIDDDSQLSATLRDQPQHGTVELSADGSFTYVPRAGYSGTDSFTYVASGAAGGVSEPARVSITVDPAPPCTPLTTVNSVIGTVRTADGGRLTIDLRRASSRSAYWSGTVSYEDTAKRLKITSTVSRKKDAVQLVAGECRTVRVKVAAVDRGKRPSRSGTLNLTIADGIPPTPDLITLRFGRTTIDTRSTSGDIVLR